MDLASGISSVWPPGDRPRQCSGLFFGLRTHSCGDFMWAVVTAIALLPLMSSAGGTSAAALESRIAHRACAMLASVELYSDQKLTFRWNNACGFPVIVMWQSRSDEGVLVTGTLMLPPHQSGAGYCTRCALPEWTESWHGREA